MGKNAWFAACQRSLGVKPIDKPKKPRRDCPLFAHDIGQWCKKIKDKPWHFGVRADRRSVAGAHCPQADAGLAFVTTYRARRR